MESSLDKLQNVLSNLGYNNYTLHPSCIPIISRLLLEIVETKGEKNKATYIERNLNELKSEVEPLYSDIDKLKEENKNLHLNYFELQEQNATLSSNIDTIKHHHLTEIDNYRFLISQLSKKLLDAKEKTEKERFKLAELIDKKIKSPDAINYSYGISISGSLEPMKPGLPSRSPPPPQKINMQKLVEKNNKELQADVCKLKNEVELKNNEIKNLKTLLKDRSQEIVSLSDRCVISNQDDSQNNSRKKGPIDSKTKLANLETQLELMLEKKASLEKLLDEKEEKLNTVIHKNNLLLNKSHEFRQKNIVLIEKVKKLESIMLDIEPKKIALPPTDLNYNAEGNKLAKELRESRLEAKKLLLENKKLVNSLINLHPLVEELTQQLYGIRTKVLHGSSLIPEDIEIPSRASSVELNNQLDIDYLKSRLNSLQFGSNYNLSNTESHDPTPEVLSPAISNDSTPNNDPKQDENSLTDRKLKKLNKKIEHLTVERDNLRSLYYQINQELINTRQSLDNRQPNQYMSSQHSVLENNNASFAKNSFNSQTELDRLKLELSKKEIELEKRKIEIEDLREHLEAAQVIQDSDQLGIKTRLERVETRFHKCLQDKVLLSQQCADLVKEMENFRNQALISQESEKTLKNQLSQLEKDYGLAKEQLGKLRKQEVPNEAKISELSEEISNLLVSKESLRKQLSQVQSSLKERDELVTKLNNELSSLTKQLDIKTRELEEAQYTIRQNEANSKAYEQQCDYLSQAVSSLERQLKQCRS